MTKKRINEIYQQAFGRNATADEIEHHITHKTPEAMLKSWAFSHPLYLNKVKEIYQTNFNRQPTASEIEHHKTHYTPVARLTEWAAAKKAPAKEYEKYQEKWEEKPKEKEVIKEEPKTKITPEEPKTKITPIEEESPVYEQLDEENKKIVDYYKEILEEQNKEKEEAFEQALSIAEKQADPYFKEKIRLIEDELARTFGTLEADLASREEELARRQAEIKEDLKYQTEYLSTEQQAELARREKEYDEELKTIRETMAQRGLTFSTIRTEAQEKIKTGYEDVVESIERQYARALRAEGLGAERLQADITQQIEDLKRQMGEAKTKAVRGAEEYLGSQALTLPEYEPFKLGGITGRLEEEKTRDILERQRAILEQEYQF